MALGVGLGAGFDRLPGFIDSLSIGSFNIPIGIGLILMMYPRRLTNDHSASWSTTES